MPRMPPACDRKIWSQAEGSMPGRGYRCEAIDQSRAEREPDSLLSSSALASAEN